MGGGVEAIGLTALTDVLAALTPGWGSRLAGPPTASAPDSGTSERSSSVVRALSRDGPRRESACAVQPGATAARAG